MHNIFYCRSRTDFSMSANFVFAEMLIDITWSCYYGSRKYFTSTAASPRHSKNNEIFWKNELPMLGLIIVTCRHKCYIMRERKKTLRYQKISNFAVRPLKFLKVKKVKIT